MKKSSRVYIQRSRTSLCCKIANEFACNTWLVAVVTVIILIQHSAQAPSFNLVSIVT